MSKKFDTTRAENELKGASAFFRSSSAATPAPVEPQPTPDPVLPQLESTKTPAGAPAPQSATNIPSDRTGDRSDVRPTVRTVSRHSFEFYLDQIDALKRLSLEDRMLGGDGNMSRMVRLAIDDYLKRSKESA